MVILAPSSVSQQQTVLPATSAPTWSLQPEQSLWAQPTQLAQMGQGDVVATQDRRSALRSQTPEEPSEPDSAGGPEGSREELTEHSPPLGVSEDLPVSPLDDFRSFTDIIQKMVARLGVSTSQPSPEVNDVFFEVVRPNLSSTLAIPLSKVLLQTVKDTWQIPASVPISTKKLDHLYCIQETSAEFLFKHPQPNSVVVSSASKSKRHHSTPPDREGKKLDSYGR